MQRLAHGTELNRRVSDAALLVYCKAVAAMSSRREGQGLVEYGLVLAIIALVAMAALKSVGQGLMAALTAIANDLATR